MLAHLLDSLPTPIISNGSGYWSVVRLCIDLAAQEWVNVGIVLDCDNGERHYRLADNLAGLRCFYNDDAVDTARFLFDQAEHMLEMREPIPNGWNIALSTRRYCRVDTPELTISDLFHRLVPMARHQAAGREDREDHPHATANVRKSVRQLLSKHLGLAKTALPDFWRNTPTTIHQDGSEVQLDAQVIGHVGNIVVHGAVASAWYKTRYHRNASLSLAVNAMTTAAEAFPNGKNVLYLLKPPTGVSTLGETDYKAIEQDIVSSDWLLKKHGATLMVVQSEEVMAATILRDLRLLPELA